MLVDHYLDDKLFPQVHGEARLTEYKTSGEKGGYYGQNDLEQFPEVHFCTGCQIQAKQKEAPGSLAWHIFSWIRRFVGDRAFCNTELWAGPACSRIIGDDRHPWLVECIDTVSLC